MAVADQQGRSGAPSPWVMRFLHGVKPAGHVLDLACGGGRHVAPCLASGRRVTALDHDLAVVRERFAATAGSGLAFVEIDLEGGRPFPFEPATFDGVIVTNYLWRPILPGIVTSLAPGGVLMYETFQACNERYGRPKNSAFLLKSGELLAAVRDRLHVVAYEEARLGQPDRVVQRICAVGPDHEWLNEPPPL